MDSETLQWIKNLIATNRLEEFYTSPQWRRIRKEILQEQHYECQVAKGEGHYEAATTVHHVIPLREAPWLAFDKSNLIAVSAEAHWKIHHRGKNWDDERW
ncbi:MAG: HNH endonuclease [Oscillospiraceae bacterium]